MIRQSIIVAVAFASIATCALGWKYHAYALTALHGPLGIQIPIPPTPVEDFNKKIAREENQHKHCHGADK